MRLTMYIISKISVSRVWGGGGGGGGVAVQQVYSKELPSICCIYTYPLVIMLCWLSQIVTAGSGGVIRHWSINGQALSCVPSEQVGHIFSCAFNTNNKKNQVKE